MAEAKGERMLLLAFNGCLKVVTYWLAKLLDPQQSVVLSDEHQDFQVPYPSPFMTVKQDPTEGCHTLKSKLSHF